MVISRRRMLAGALGGAAIAAAPLRRARAAAPGGLHTIEHVVITVQENRSFDHFFGTLSGVRGFDDPSALPGVFRQAWNGPGGRLAPFHLNSQTTAGACHNDITHAWVAQHQSWNGGRMDRWARVHAASDGAAYGPATMGYYTRADLPTYYALADAFTLCDGYHCSVLGPSQPNQ